MAKAYWIVTYRSEDDPKALAEYAKLAGPTVLSAGGRTVVHGMPAKSFEAGLDCRTIVVEFDSLAIAISTWNRRVYVDRGRFPLKLSSNLIMGPAVV